MRMMRFVGSFILGLGILLTQNLTAQDPTGLPPQIDSQVHIVAWVDVDRVSFEELLQWANQTELAPLLQGISDPEKVAPANSLVESLRRAGAQRVFVTGSATALMGDLSALGLIIRCDQPDRCAAALEATPLLPGQVIDLADGAVLLAMSPEGLEELGEIQGTPSSSLAAGLESMQDSLGVVAAFPASILSLLLQGAPQDDSPQSAALQSLVDLKWARATGSPPNSKLKLEGVFDSKDSATGFAKQVNLATKSAFNVEMLLADQNRVMLASQGAEAIAEITKVARAEAIKTDNLNKLRQMAVAFLNFENSQGALPPQALTDNSGKRLLSWRVLILPYIEEGELYKQFHLDEAWDSPHNLTLLEKMPEAYRSKTVVKEHELKPGHTRFLAPLTTDSIMGKAGGPTRFREITDGTSNTILLVEAAPSSAVPWTKPADLLINPMDPRAGLITEDQTYWAAVFADGGVRLLIPSLASEILKALFSCNGGELIPAEKLEESR